MCDNNKLSFINQPTNTKGFKPINQVFQRIDQQLNATSTAFD